MGPDSLFWHTPLKQILMKNTLLFCLLFAGGTAFAQPVQTLYYPNGKKYIEGHWTYAKRDFLSQSVRLEGYRTGLKILEPSERQVPDGDTAIMQRHQWQNAQNPMRYLNIIPEGLLTCWIYEGGGYLQITYKGGVPNGPFKEYYAPGQPLQEGTVLNGMPNGPWTYYYKNGKPLYRGNYKAYSQSQLEGLWDGDNSGTKANSSGNKDYRKNNLSDILNIGQQMGIPMPFNNLLMTGTQKHGAFTFWYKDGSKWAETAFDLHQPAGIWKVWGQDSKTPKLILELAGSGIAFVTDSTGTRRNFEDTKAFVRAQMEAALKTQMEAAGTRIKGRHEVRAGEVGISEPPQESSPFTYVNKMPKFKGNINTWLAENLRYPPEAQEAEGLVVVRFTVQSDGSLSDLKVEKGVNAALDAEALRLINAMPNWEPGKQNGKPVKVYSRVPVQFKLK